MHPHGRKDFRLEEANRLQLLPLLPPCLEGQCKPAAGPFGEAVSVPGVLIPKSRHQTSLPKAQQLVRANATMHLNVAP